MPPQRLHHAKFRWTENLTCRFIQLRKENGKLFTGRKYSAQAGWELILRQMREEFPTIMAHVHYRVLKKKWSNLLQQYKELRNPVHGDRNKADDVSWPFFGAIDQVLEDSNRQTAALLSDDYIDPQEFLCVSVTPEVPGLSSEGRPAGSDAELRSKDSTILTLRRLQSPDNNDDDDDDDCSIEIDEHGAHSRTGRLASGLVPPGKRYTHSDPVPRIPRATGLSIERIPPVSGEKRTEDDLRHRRFQRDANSAEGTGSGQSLRRRETIVDPPRSPPIAPTWTPGDGGGGGEPAGLENRRVHQVVGGQLAETSNCQSRRTISEARQVSGGNWPLRETLNEAKQSGAGDGRALESGADGEDAKWQRGKPRKPGRVRATRGSCPGGEEDDRELRIYQRLEQLLEYARRRDEENRSIMMRILQAVEAIAKKL